MAVTNNFKSSSLDLNGKVALSQPTALVWGPDGRLYVTEVDGGVKVLTVAFGIKNPTGSDQTAQFHVTQAVTLNQVKSIPNFNDDGTPSGQTNRQVTGIDVTPQFDASGNPVLINGKPAVTIYVTSSDSRIGAGANGADSGLDTNSGTITKLTQTGPNAWSAVDLVRGLARSEENHALNGLEVVQVVNAQGKLVSERLIVAAGGNANSGAPSNNFAGQQEQPLSAAILEIDLDMLKAMPVKTDPSSGRAYVYDAPTLDDPSRPNTAPGVDVNDPFGGNDGFNAAKLIAGGPIRIYSPGYRNAYDVEVTDDGRVFTYDNGANGTWGGRPIGEAGDNGGTIDFLQAANYIATNLNNGDGNSNDKINLVNWKPSNKDQLHEVTRSDDLAGRALSAGQGGATTYVDPLSGHTLVYGGHPNPTRAEGSRAGLLFSPGKGSDDAFLLVSNVDSYGNGGGSDHQEVIAWLKEVEAAHPKPSSTSLYGVAEGALTSRVLAVSPGVLYDIYKLAAGGGAAVVAGAPAPAGGTFLGKAGLPADIAQIVAFKNPIEGNYLEAGKTDGALDTGNGSINGLTEYTSAVFDQGGVKMAGAIVAVSLGGSYIFMGRDEGGVMPTGVNAQGFTVAALRTTFPSGGAPLGLASIGDDYGDLGLSMAFRGSIWSAIYKQNGPLIEILQPNNGAVPLAGSVVVNEVDTDGDGVDFLHDPFVFSAANGYKLGAGQSLVLDFSPLNKNFLDSFSSTGLLGAALDGVTPNQDARTAAENFAPDQQRPGLFDNGGNILPGGNAPIFQIKKVAPGTVVGAANTARDAMHTGILPDADVKRISAVVDVKNWVAEKGTPLTGQLTGLMFGDGTQKNFLRVVFGGVQGVGPGLEVGYEIGDANYTVLARVALPQLLSSGVPEIALKLGISKIGQSSGFDVSVAYKLAGQADFTTVPLLGGAGFKLPVGVLRDVLTGAHTITSGGPAVKSGAAVGFLAEDVPGGDLKAIDFLQLAVEGFGNEIAATTAAGVGASGTSGIDTILYTGTQTALAALASNVEHFDGSGSKANYAVTGNALSNIIRVGPGANTITTGGGADSVRGTLADLAGDTITDFSFEDEVVILGAKKSALSVAYGAGAGGGAVVTLGGAALTIKGSAVAGFDPAQGGATFVLEDVSGGVRLTARPPLTPVLAINAGGPPASNLVLRDQAIAFVSDLPTAPKVGFTLTGSSSAYSNSKSLTTDFPGTDLDPLHAYERTSASTGKWGYAIAVENGTYLVDLIYSEIFHGFVTGIDTPGQRTFDVFIENALVQNDYDIIADAGAPGAEVIKSYEVTVTDGVLNIEFLKELDQAKLSGLAVWAKGAGATPPPPADTTPPVVVSIAVETPPSAQGDQCLATVVLSDAGGGFSLAALQALTGAELVFTGIVPKAVSAPTVALSNGGQSATLSYKLTPPDQGWPTGQGQVKIAAGAYKDAAGNGTAAATGGFVFDPGPGGGAVFALDFETAGNPLAQGGFTGLLGGTGALEAAKAQVAGGKLKIVTSDGDLSSTIPTASKNDFVRAADVSAAALVQLNLATRFDNPFNAAFLAERGLTTSVPNYLQQGLVVATGDPATNQGANQFVKLVWGGNGGTGVQMWSQGAVNQIIKVTAMSSAAKAAGQPTFDVTKIASVELSLAIDKAAGTIAQLVTLYDAAGKALGGVRPEATAGFVTAAPQAMPAAVKAAIAGGTSVFGVTSSDFDAKGDAIPSFTATWDALTLTSPQTASGPAPQPIAVSIANAPTVLETGDTGATDLAFPLSAPGFSGAMTVTYTVGGAAQSKAVTFANGAGTLVLAVPNDAVDTGDTVLAVTLTKASASGQTFTINPAAAQATGTVKDDDGAAGPIDGALAFAVNVGGPQVSATDGTVFEADTGAGWTNSFPYFDGKFDPKLASGDYNRDGVTNGDDTVYATERFGGPPGGTPMTYTRTGIEPGSYVLTLKLAENYDPNFTDNARVFSVAANGASVVKDLDLFDKVAQPDQAYDLKVPVTVGANGVLTLAFQASADHAKVNALALHKAAPPPSGGGGAGKTEQVFKIKSSNDDHESVGKLKGVDLDFGFEKGVSPQTVGMRFAGVTIPKGAVIEDAFLRFEAYANKSKPASFVIEIQGSKTAASYTSASTPDQRTYVDDFLWSNVQPWTAGQTYRTPDISKLIDTVVGTGGMTNGALAFRVKSAPDNTGDRVAHAWDSTTGAEPELVLLLASDSLL